MTLLFGHRPVCLLLLFFFASAILCGQIWFEGNARGVFQLGGGIGWQYDGILWQNNFYADLSFSVFDPMKWFLTANLGARFDPTDSGDTRIFSEIVYSNLLCIGAGGTWGPASGGWSVHVMGGVLLPLLLLGADINFIGPPHPPGPCVLFIPNAVLFVRLGTESFSSIFLELGIKLKWCLGM